MEAELINGVMIGIVVSIDDPAHLSRIKVQFPWLGGLHSNWARVVSFHAGADRGAYFLPRIDDEVLVAFEGGDIASPYVIGALWNGKDRPPVEDEKRADVHAIKTKGGTIVRFDDTENEEKIEITVKDGSQIVIDAASGAVSIVAKTEISLTAKEGKIRLDGGTIEIVATDTLSLNGKQITVTASEAASVAGKPVRLN